MNRSSEFVAIVALTVGTICSCSSLPALAQEEPNEEVLALIIEFVKDTDRETRAIGLQQIREELPGEAVTRRLVQLLPDLPPDARVDLLDALGDRGDAVARPLALESLNGDTVALRLAAIRAVGALGSTEDVELLAEKAGKGNADEKKVATQALVRLRGEGVNEAIAALAADAETAVRVVMLGVLAGRNARETLPQVKQAAEDSDAAIRSAAIQSLRYLADQEDVPSLISILKKAATDRERYTAELALLTVCSRVGEPCTEALTAGLADGDAAAQLALLHALARIGNEAALQQTLTLSKEGDPAVRDEAVRMLANWKDDSVRESLLQLARASEPPQHRVLALRGLVRIAAPVGEQPGDVALLKQVMNLASRTDEKRLALGALSGAGSVESLDLALACLDDAELTEVAALAVIAIAAKMENGDSEKIQAAIKRALGSIKDEQVRQRAEELWNLSKK